MRALLIFNRNIINVHNILAVSPLSKKSWLSACGWQLTNLRTISLDNMSLEHVRFASVCRRDSGQLCHQVMFVQHHAVIAISLCQ